MDTLAWDDRKCNCVHWKATGRIIVQGKIREFHIKQRNPRKNTFYDFNRKISRNHKIVFFLVVGLFLVLVVLVVVLVAFRLVVTVVASHYCDYQEESHQNHHQDHPNQK